MTWPVVEPDPVEALLQKQGQWRVEAARVLYVKNYVDRGGERALGELAFDQMIARIEESDEQA